MSSVALTKGPFPGFTQLASTVWYYDPRKHGSNSNGAATAPAMKQPDLLILSTWMGAAPKHILKYIIGYQALFPKTPILMFTNTVYDIMTRTTRRYKEKLKPAVRVIREAATSKEDPQILLHLYSNGGANIATSLAYFYNQNFGAPLPITALVLDSAPGVATYRRSIAAMSVGLPRFILLRILGLIVIHFLCVVMWITHHIFKQENAISQIRKQLIDPTLFPLSAPRVYVYSKTDRMVGWKDVEYNAHLAKQNGYEVSTEMYENTEHVGHLRQDPQRYWAVVKSVLR